MTEAVGALAGQSEFHFFHTAQQASPKSSSRGATSGLPHVHFDLGLCFCVKVHLCVISPSFISATVVPSPWMQDAKDIREFRLLERFTVVSFSCS